MARAQPASQQDEAHHESARQERAKRRQSVVMQPPLTPMIDVTFQLLLFFLLTMTFRLEEGMIRGALPEKGLGAPSETNPLTEPIVVRLLAEGEFGKDVTFLVDSRKMSNGQELHDFFLERIKDLGGSKESPIIIAPQAEVRWRWVVEVFNQAARAEFEEIGFTRATG